MILLIDDYDRLAGNLVGFARGPGSAVEAGRIASEYSWMRADLLRFAV